MTDARAGGPAPRGGFGDTAVVMITRNEEGAIAKVLKELHYVVPGADVIVVDGSTDRTPEIATAHGAHVVPEPGGGPAPALVAGFRATDRAIVATVDADDTYPPELLPAIIELVRCNFDVVGTDRLGFGRPPAMPGSNYLANWTFNVIASIRTRRRVHDVHSGMRAYRRAVIERFPWDTTRAALPVDLLLWPIITGSRVLEIPIEYHERIGTTKLARLPGTLSTLYRLLRPFRQSWRPADELDHSPAVSSEVRSRSHGEKGVEHG
jgi:glycosyltransferase involved in cell wall biosynthesis